MPSITGCPGVVVKSGGGVGSNPIATVDAVASVPLGTRGYGPSGEEYIYLQGIGATIVGSVVTYDGNGLTTLIVPATFGQVAVALAATIVNTFGWYCVRSGLAGIPVSCDAGIVNGAKGYVDTTAGRVDDTVVAGSQITGFTFRSVDTAGIASAQIDYPSFSGSLG